jgi:hypothetical protein
MRSPVVSWVNRCDDTECHDLDFEDILSKIKNGTWQGQVEKYRAACRAGKNGKAPKNWLPAFTPSGRFSARNAEGLVAHSKLIVADLDHLGTELEPVRKKLESSPHVYCVFVSIGGDGLKAFFYVAMENPAQHPDAFRAVDKHVFELTGKRIDQGGKDTCRLCAVSSDPKIYVNQFPMPLEPLPPEPARPKANERNGSKPSKAEMREMLAVIPKRPDYPGWLKIVSAVGDALPNDDAIEVLNEWSPEEHDGEYADKLRHRLKDVTIGTLIHLAQKHGWKNNGAALSFAFVDLQKVTSQAVTWIEEPFLARGELHALMGLGGSYKGTLTLTWAAEFSRKGEHVILLSAEDSLDKKIKPLLEAAAADMRFIHPMKVQRGADEEMLILPDQIPLLEAAVVDVGAKLVVIDPLVTYIPATLNTHKDHDMKRALTPLSSLAQRTNTTIVGILHEKKDRSGSAKQWAQGSLAFGTTCRVQMAMHKNTEEEVTLEVVKSNIGREGAGILLRADIVEIDPGIKVPRLTRAGQAPLSIQDLVNGQKGEELSKIEQGAIYGLDDLEEEGEQKQAEFFEKIAAKTGLKIGTVKRHVYWGILQEEGLVNCRKDGFTGGWMVSRSERDRPKRLQTLTSNRDTAPKTLSRCHSSEDLPSIANRDPNTTSCHISSNSVSIYDNDNVSLEYVMLGELSAGVQAQ